MVNYLKKTILLFMVLLLVIRPYQALGIDLGSAFSKLIPGGAAVSVNSPGHFQSGVRNTFSGGGFEMRVPRGNVTPALISFTPPYITAGCNGISAHFGGLSFISGEEFENLIKQIGTGVIIGFVIQMAIKIACPFCEDIINKLRTAAELAAKLAMDGCNAGLALGKALADSAYDSYMKPNNNTTNTEKETKGAQACAVKAGQAGSASDSLQALFTQCKTVSDAIDYGIKALKIAMGIDPKDTTSDKAKAIEAKEKCEAGYGGNVTWASLKAADANPDSQTAYFGGSSKERKLLFMNMLGAKVQDPPPRAGDLTSVRATCQEDSSQTPEPDKFCKPKFQPTDADLLAAIIMCGTDTTKGGFSSKVEYIKNFCEKYTPEYNGKDGAKKDLPMVYDCVLPAGGVTDDAYKDCTDVRVRPFGQVFTGMSDGYLTKVDSLLRWGMTQIIANKPLIDSSKAESIQLLQLINMAPFPVYQALNVSAVYPAAAGDILNAMGVIIAQQLAVSQLNEMLRIQGRSGMGVECGMNYSTILTVAEKSRAKTNEFLADVAKNFTVQQQVIAQIRSLNIAIQKEVLNTEMFASARFAQNVAGGINAAK